MDRSIGQIRLAPSEHDTFPAIVERKIIVVVDVFHGFSGSFDFGFVFGRVSKFGRVIGFRFTRSLPVLAAFHPKSCHRLLFLRLHQMTRLHVSLHLFFCLLFHLLLPTRSDVLPVGSLRVLSSSIPVTIPISLSIAYRLWGLTLIMFLSGRRLGVAFEFGLRLDFFAPFSATFLCSRLDVRVDIGIIFGSPCFLGGTV